MASSSETDARRAFWTRPGTFAIVGGFEAPGKLSWMLLEQCQKDGISAVPVNPDAEEVLGVSAVANPADIDSLAGIVCVRLDPYATAAVQSASELRVPVWLSMRTATPSARTLAEETGVEIIADVCPMLYTNAKSYHSVHRVIAKVFGAY